MTIFEIAVAPASQAYLEDPEIFTPALNWLAKAPGQIKQWTGLQVEDQKSVYHVIEWETHEHHQNLPSHPQFQELLGLIKPCFSGAPKIFHVPFVPPVDEALSAPVTEFCTSKANSKELQPQLFQLLSGAARKVSTGKGCFGPTVGETTEDSDTIIMVIGWDAIQTHLDAVAGDEGVKTVWSISATGVFHAPMKKHVIV